MVLLGNLLVTIPNLLLLVSATSPRSLSLSSEELELVVPRSRPGTKSYRVVKTKKSKSKPKVYNMTCDCGLGVIGEARAEAKTRIVNGYVPEHRAWMVYLQVLDIFVARRLSTIFDY
jgi:hypothetical protein